MIALNTYIDKIADKNALLFQAEQLKKRRFNPGFDGMTGEKAYLWFGMNGYSVSEELKKGRYKPMPVVGFLVAKKNGGYRRLVKTAAADTVIQNVIADTVREKCETLFSDSSHAYRPGKGVFTALEQYCRLAEGHSFAANVDPISCFDNIDRNVLKTAVSEFFGDEALTDLIMSFVNVPVYSDGKFEYPERGIFQGTPVSNMLSNIYLHALDTFLEGEGIPFVRYADDVVIFAKNLSSIETSVRRTKAFMVERLKLLPNEKKCRIDNSLNISFLSHRFESNKGCVIALENNVNNISAYRNWHEELPFDFHNVVDILSDGILRPKDYSLIFESDSGVADLPVKNIEVINIYSNVIFDSNFLKVAFENKIIVNVFNKSNKLIGRFIPNAPLKSPKTTNNQLLCYCNTEERLKLARTFVLASIHNTRLNIRYYNKQTPQEVFKKALNKINNTENKIKMCQSHEELLMLEAQVREAYYSCYESFIRNEEFSFVKRTRRPPMNEVNAMLSFGNVVLYNYLATGIAKSSLDIRTGFLHATNNRTESLNLDLAEIFKPLIVDRVVFSLINLRSINSTHFYTEENGGVYLNENGKQIFLRAFYEKLNTVVTVKQDRHSYRRIIKDEIRQLGLYFKNNEKYTGFRQVR